MICPSSHKQGTLRIAWGLGWETVLSSRNKILGTGYPTEAKEVIPTTGNDCVTYEGEGGNETPSSDGQSGEGIR